MSTTIVTPRRKGVGLDEPTRRAIVARIVETNSITLTAKEFGIHINTASRLWNSVKAVRNSGTPSNWREKLVQDLPAQSVAAIERSVKDTDDVHKAASTALSHLKGIGVLASEGGANVNVFVQAISGLPADWQREYFTTDEADTTTCRDVTPESGAITPDSE